MNIHADNSKNLTKPGGERRESYGSPVDDFTRLGKLWGVLLRIDPIPPEMVGLMLVALKINRESHKHKPDNLVDAHGYLNCVEEIINSRTYAEAPKPPPGSGNVSVADAEAIEDLRRELQAFRAGMLHEPYSGPELTKAEATNRSAPPGTCLADNVAEMLAARALRILNETRGKRNNHALLFGFGRMLDGFARNLPLAEEQVETPEDPQSEEHLQDPHFGPELTKADVDAIQKQIAENAEQFTSQTSDPGEFAEDDVSILDLPAPT